MFSANVVKGQKAMIAGYCTADNTPALDAEAKLFASLWGGEANQAALERSKKGRNKEQQGQRGVDAA